MKVIGLDTLKAGHVVDITYKCSDEDENAVAHVKGVVTCMKRSWDCCLICNERSKLGQVGSKFTLVTFDTIKEIQLLQEELIEYEQYPSIPDFSEELINERERIATEERRLMAAKVGVDVSPEGQFIFDYLAKTMDCHWFRQTIVVHGEVDINPPYDLKSITGSNDKMVQHVLKAVQQARKKLNLDQ